MAAKGAGSFDANSGTKVGLEAWRIENLNPVRCEEALAGSLFSGDSYLFLHTTTRGASLEWDLFFWLGKDSSQDEQGGAALRTVELDDQLGGGPVQFRETEGNETSHFLKLFKGGICTKDGGVASAFNKVDRDEYESRLFHLSGKRTVKATKVDRHASSMNEGDVFILDQGKTIYQWNGKEANKYEKFKGLEMVKKINDQDRGGKCEQVFLDSGRNDESCAQFWNELGGKKSDVKPATPDKIHKASAPKLIKISDESGKLLQTVVGEGKLTYEMINSNDAFIVDVVSEVFVWVGKGASKEEKSKGMRFGVDYVKEQDRIGCPIAKFIEGRESAQFKNYFKGWPAVAASGNKEADLSALYAKKAKADAKVQELDGKIVSIWRIKDLAKEPLDESAWGQFWAGDSFILLYTYKLTPSKEGHIIYFWQGRDSSTDEKAASALLTKELDDEMGGDPVQVRVVMGKEPPHFLSMFKGRMIIHEGGVASGFKNVKDSDSFDTDGISLFHVRGNSPLNTRAAQVPEKPASLNSGDCFVLLTPATMYVWNGEGANDDEKATAQNISTIMKGDRAQEDVAEGSEPEGFWTGLGGKGEYVKGSKDLGEMERDPILFQISVNTGSLRVENIPDYDQSDLVMDDVMMLDTYTEVFLWVGPQALPEEKDGAMKAALDYIKKVDDGRDLDTPVYRITAGFEPPQFTQHFLGWDASKSDPDAPDPYLAQLAAMGIKVEGGLISVSSGDVGFKEPGFKSFTLEELQAKAPAGVDPACKELYLSDEDLATHLKMDRAAWGKLPKWKKGAAKKTLKLF